MKFNVSAVLETLAAPSIECIRNLGKDRTMTIPLKGKVSVYCLAGILWASVEGKGEDILVEAGQTRVIEGRGKLVISALDDSRLWVG